MRRANLLKVLLGDPLKIRWKTNDSTAEINEIRWIFIGKFLSIIEKDYCLVGRKACWCLLLDLIDGFDKTEAIETGENATLLFPG